MQSLVVGLGRAGAGLHLPVLAKARAREPELLGGEDVVACDPRRTPPDRPGLVTTASIGSAAAGLDPAGTVVHICTPPVERHAVITELAELGFRNMIVEKPLASDADDLARIIRVRRKHRLHIEVVEPWLSSTLTRRLIELTRCGLFGPPKSITIVQNKPRFRRSLAAPGHPTAFDVELPHGVALALRLAGAARVTHAAGADLEVDGQFSARMGGADVGLRHISGVRTEISSDLTCPVRERRVTIDFANGSAVGHFAVSDDDDHSQLTVRANGHREHLVLRDDSLTEWMIQAYRRFREGGEQTRGFNFAAEVVQLLSVAKNICAEPVVPTARTEAGFVAVAHHAG
ncbi:Predicted dehydrogenase [Lentzea albidocapillata subsp. violacea]|uniref:Predicted dehydrogenase n=1 Tax=Lentzea albidocapillata subsp. violacea TaxID=128104 RepID=A0A1G8SJB6_9PSEU|nr:Gfo/Idh/MocA family oxidoreductase [Lentzea albidocapillata]SDJ29336.1 Predicted dehydrogenase [Lentzea albidocapillata subsp. violacea]